LSFFDEVDEPSPGPPRRRPSGGRRGPPPSDAQTIRFRRIVALVVVVIFVVVVLLLVHGCQESAQSSALRNYNNSVSTVIQRSNQTGSQLFSELSGGANSTTLQHQIAETGTEAAGELATAQGFSVPSAMRGAQDNVLLALQMRHDGIEQIAAQIEPALSGSSKGTAVAAIAAQVARFYASDVVYADYATAKIAAALHADGIAVGPPDGVTIYSGQFVPSLDWLTPQTIAKQLHVTVSSSSSGTPAPGRHGHQLNSVSVDGTTLQTGSTNTIPASPPPTFTFNFTNQGTDTETNVVLMVTVAGTSISATHTVSQTTAGETLNAAVTLPSSPPAGTYQVTATVEKVLGETYLANNTLQFSVAFQ
jgi:hypothetical protein